MQHWQHRPFMKVSQILQNDKDEAHSGSSPSKKHSIHRGCTLIAILIKKHFFISACVSLCTQHSLCSSSEAKAEFDDKLKWFDGRDTGKWIADKGNGLKQKARGWWWGGFTRVWRSDKKRLWQDNRFTARTRTHGPSPALTGARRVTVGNVRDDEWLSHNYQAASRLVLLQWWGISASDFLPLCRPQTGSNLTPRCAWLRLWCS